ncbi:MAG: hypothetical protein ACOWWM_11285 [Desulfobacterales bacterium]
MVLRLNLTRHCIETALRQHHERCVSSYFRPGSDTAELEVAMEACRFALESLDFPCLRTRYPVLSGGTAHAVSLSVEGGRIELTIDGNPVDLVWRNG